MHSVGPHHILKVDMLVYAPTVVCTLVCTVECTYRSTKPITDTLVRLLAEANSIRFKTR